MATRRQNYGLVTVTNRDRFGNTFPEVIATYYLDVQSADGGKKPNPLIDTRMLVRRLENNVGRYTGIPDTLSTGKTGSVGFVFSSWLPKTITGGTGGAAGESSAVNMALAKFGSGSINLGTSIGEGSETVKTVVDSAKRLAEAFVQVKKGQFLKAADVLSTDLTRRQMAHLNSLRPAERLSNGWLTYQYGIKPIVNDVYGAVEQYHKDIKVGTEVYASVGKKSSNIRAHSSDTRYTRNSALEQMAGRNFARSPTRPRVTIRGTVANKNLRTLQELGLLNIAALAWELRPLSFVVDWFLNIGDFVGGVTATAGMGNVSVCVVGVSYTETYVNGIFMNRETFIDRKPLPAVPQFPGLTIAGLSNERLASAISLLIQRSR